MIQNLALLCAGHHDYMHQHPAMGMKLGWLVDRRKDPAHVSTTLGDGSRVFLTPGGEYREAGRDRTSW